MHKVNSENRILVLGATGGIGREVSQQLLAKGWTIVALSRQPDSASKTFEHTPKPEQIIWIKGDAMNEKDVRNAAQGCTIIFHAVNPPGYKNWEKSVVPMLKNSIQAAKQHNATILFPGTIYNYGPDAWPNIYEYSPQNAMTKKGQLRVQMETELKVFANNGGRVIIIRAGDFFGPSAKNNWFSQGLVNPNKTIKSIYNLLKEGIGHQWAYLPDVAKTMILTIEKRSELEPFALYQMQGHWDSDGTSMIKAIQKVVQKTTNYKPSVSRFPWWALWIAAPFNTTMRELLEMKYLWQQPIRMHNDRLINLLGAEPHTPIEEAVEQTLASFEAFNNS